MMNKERRVFSVIYEFQLKSNRSPFQREIFLVYWIHTADVVPICVDSADVKVNCQHVLDSTNREQRCGELVRYGRRGHFEVALLASNELATSLSPKFSPNFTPNFSPNSCSALSSQFCRRTIYGMSSYVMFMSFSIKAGSMSICRARRGTH